jgi:hypothetical protein
MPNLVGDPNANFLAEVAEIKPDGTTPASPAELNNRYQRLLDNDLYLRNRVAAVEESFQVSGAVGELADALLTAGATWAVYSLRLTIPAGMQLKLKKFKANFLASNFVFDVATDRVPLPGEEFTESGSYTASVGQFEGSPDVFISTVNAADDRVWKVLIRVRNSGSTGDELTYFDSFWALFSIE